MPLSFSVIQIEGFELVKKKKTKRKSTRKTTTRQKRAPKTKAKTRAKSKKPLAKIAKVAVDGLSLKDIKSLEQELQKAKTQARDRERKALKAKIDKLIEGTGFTIFDLYGIGGKKRGKSVSVARYANPDDPTDTWTGRGRKPNWVLARLAKGEDLENFAI